MARRLRKIDDVGKIKDWIATRAAINRLLKEVDVKTYSDDWRPWRQKGKTQKKVLELDKNERCVKKAFNESVLKDTQNKKTVDWGAMGVYWDKSKADSECLNGLWILM